MSTAAFAPQAHGEMIKDPIQQQVAALVDDLIVQLPNPAELTRLERRGIIARYTAVLEGNFIYWMTATYLSVQSEAARPILIDNLMEEVGDCHPEMLRRFAIAAHAFPTDTDALAVSDDLTKVRLFLGRLSGVQNLLTMGFFETYIQRFMSYLADLAVAQGSADLEYTDVHGVCDIAHSEGLLLALGSEMEINPLDPAKDLFEGVALLSALLDKVVYNRAENHLVA
jgi:hypothetical protein